MEPNQNPLYPGGEYREQSVPVETVGRYAAKTFLWMFAGLLVTFLTAVTLVESGLIFAVFSIPGLHLILLFAQLGVVLFLSARIGKLSVTAARVLFFVYAALNGVVFSILFLAYNVFSLILAFGATALYFGGMALFGLFTRVDLSRIRNLLLGGLIFLVVFGLLSLFIPGLEAADRILCMVGVVVFMGFTAYDTQKMKAYYAAYQWDDAMLQKASIFSALQLYLDFINLFLYLLRILGRRRR